LSRREVKLGMRVRLLDDLSHLAEDADNVVAMGIGTELISTATRVPSAPTTTTPESVTSVVPRIFRANSSLARLESSGATADVNWRSRRSPTMFSAARFSQRMTPVASIR
jgi:hypothetical protein